MGLNIKTLAVVKKMLQNTKAYLTESSITTALGYTPINSNKIGSADGIASLDTNGKLHASQLPFEVDADLSDVSENPIQNKVVKQAIDDEITRATAQENEILQSLNTEVTRATAAESSLTNDIINEVNRATTAENTIQTTLTEHIANFSNVDNTADIDKPVSNAQQSALDKKVDKTTVATPSTLGLVKSGTDIIVDSNGNVSVNDNSHNHTINNISDLTATAEELNVLDGITASTEELNYTDGVTSNIQTQLDSKAPTASPTLTGTPKAPTATAGTNTTQIATTAFIQTSVSNHNTSSTAHDDIRTLITTLTTKLNTLADSDDTTLNQLSEIVAYIKNNKSLIDGITTSKVNVSDIIDNLTSTATNKPLSAKQGKVLNDLITALTTTVGNKVDKVSGKGLSANDYTTAEKNKLAGIADNANNYSLPVAAAGTRGGVKIGYTANGKNYPVQLSNEQMYVNVPWTDTIPDVSGKLNKSGDKMTGTLSFSGDSALPNDKNLKYLCGINAFADGGTLRWSGVGDVKVGGANSADVATKLATARAIGCSGDVVGSVNFDGSANASMSVLRRGCIVGQSGSTNTNPYYKFASCTVAEAYNDRSITFHVTCGYGDSSTKVGILTAHFRTSGSKTWESGQLIWEYAVSGIDISKFRLAYNNTGSSCAVELWVVADIAYQLYHFDVISEGDRGARKTGLWTLYDKASGGSEAAITSGYTVINSTLATIKNSIATAAKLATKRKIGNADFDGSADITLAQIGAADRTKYGDTVVSVGRNPTSTVGTHSFCFSEGDSANDDLYSVASGAGSVVFGYGHQATGNNGACFGGGFNTVTTQDSACVGGNNNSISGVGGYNSIIGGYDSIIKNATCSVILGGSENYITTQTSHITGCACIGGTENTVSKNYSVCIGGDNNNAAGSGTACIAGNNNVANETYSVCVGGENSLADGEHSGVFGGYGGSANAAFSAIVGGNTNIAWALDSVCVGGGNNRIEKEAMDSVILGGYKNNVADVCSAVIGGNNNLCNANQVVIGHWNNADLAIGGNKSGTGTGTAFCIGNGSSVNAISNAIRMDYNGKLWCKQAYSATGADYAELFEWEDGNLSNEDRRGYFVTMVGNKIKKASTGDWILGVVSGNPCVLGNTDTEWQGQFLKDEFGQYLTEEFVETVTRTKLEPIEQEDGTIKNTRVEYEEEIHGTRYVQNPEYDPNMEYIDRMSRPEWDAVGMMGVLSVYDNGTCEVNGFCEVAEDGTAVQSNTGYRVIRRVTDSIVEIVFR